MSHQMIVGICLIFTIAIIFIDYFFASLNTSRREQEVKNRLQENVEQDGAI